MTKFIIRCPACFSNKVAIKTGYNMAQYEYGYYLKCENCLTMSFFNSCEVWYNAIKNGGTFPILENKGLIK